MWQWLKHWITGKNPVTSSPSNEFRLSDEGIYYSSWMSQTQQRPELWAWESIREFGLSIHQAIYPDPWFGDYMEAEWFFTVEHSQGPQRFFFDIDCFSKDSLPIILSEKLSGFDKLALEQGWKEYRAGLRNFKGEGQWLAWKKKGFEWPIA
jgi:hypothetical protein